ncbi:hypothetical protein AB433_15095 [Croceicoccus naphthovorans]|uniref:Helix-turn-helix domain-containing protein n=1 Tax=Croceicoccus naphthovorans TaxID=1348774 RepID=A0A0G3XMX8_9SPHN|nr:hypothetical protein AB433_15095 [Croceicoccus naphthovorans]
MNKELNVEPLAYAVKDAARTLGIGTTKFYELMNDGTIPSFKIGKRTLIRHADLVAFIDDQSKAA